jgi:hypothetical protein
MKMLERCVLQVNFFISGGFMYAQKLSNVQLEILKCRWQLRQLAINNIFAIFS